MAVRRTKRRRRDELGQFAPAPVPRRDELGRFAPLPVPRRDKLGRFAPRLVPVRDELGRFVSKPWRKPRKPPRKVPRKPPRKVPRKPPRKVPRKPPREVPRKPPRKVPRKLPRKVSRKPPRKVPRKLPRKPPRKPPRKFPRKAPRKKRRKRVLLPPSARALAAESEILSKLTGLMGDVSAAISGVDVAVKTFVNSDGTVDGELRVEDLPEELRVEENLPEIVAILSEVFRAFRPFAESPKMGGRFWVSFALRFGPQNEMELGKLAELYKRFRGMLQVGTYPAAAWHPTPIQLALTTGLKTIIEGVAVRQGFPPSVLLIRFTWTPDGRRPGHWEGEAGGKR